jgi:hypothetical protein
MGTAEVEERITNLYRTISGGRKLAERNKDHRMVDTFLHLKDNLMMLDKALGTNVYGQKNSAL